MRWKRNSSISASVPAAANIIPLNRHFTDVERLREIAEEDNGSDVKFGTLSDGAYAAFCTKQRSAPIPTRRSWRASGMAEAPYAHLYKSTGSARHCALYTVPQMRFFAAGETSRR
ncbi:hypothetical protein KCP71_14330 [Salmonella enterica subsp. enterica]|nr:hypothetical protein KCP71_14330 [Salmonella enterica subsp. enterica]